METQIVQLGDDFPCHVASYNGFPSGEHEARFIYKEILGDNSTLVPDEKRQFQELLGAEVGTSFTDKMFGDAGKVQVHPDADDTELGGTILRQPQYM
ncbi:hypothetical protein ARSEF4850_009505 [Beauveria asiatica]